MSRDAFPLHTSISKYHWCSNPSNKHVCSRKLFRGLVIRTGAKERGVLDDHQTDGHSISIYIFFSAALYMSRRLNWFLKKEISLTIYGYSNFFPESPWKTSLFKRVTPMLLIHHTISHVNCVKGGVDAAIFLELGDWTASCDKNEWRRRAYIVSVSMHAAITKVHHLHIHLNNTHFC